MKKFALILALIMTLCVFAGCTGGDKEPPTDDVTAKTPAQILLADFKAKMAENKSYTTDEMAEALVSNEIIKFVGATMPVEPGFLGGFSDEIKGFERGTMFGPIIGSIPFIGYIFELGEGADAAAFVATLKESADLRWNICVQADEMVCENVKNKVFFVMSPSSFGTDGQ